MNTKEYMQNAIKRLSTPTLDYVIQDWLETLKPFNGEGQERFEIRKRIALETFIDEKLKRAEEEYDKEGH